MAYVTGTALLAAFVVGCSADTGTGGSAADSKSGTETVAAAAPGKYRTLPEPCRAVESSMLKDLLPGAAELTEDQQRKVYEGTASVTYDTDRRVGCRWKSEGSSSSHSLFIDFERVVSYDPAVSDDDRAREVYTKKETAAGLSSPSATPDATESAESTEGGDGKGEKKQTPPADSDEASGETSDDTSGDASESTSHALTGPTPEGKSTDDENTDDGAGAPDESLQPRILDDLGDSAFLDDLLTRAGSTAQHRTVKVVFRTSNVIVTVEYTEQPAVSTAVPDSKELQEKAQALARKLVDEFSE
ncbi:DUF3558 domain-containing protein [Streptomyces sp. NBC_00378]|uniref:DUF3558 domain-containing protein n=1 Tax=unclassified Streptomyces TaxID=2593676 RepID=UPI002255BE1D|nr:MULTISPECIES: DUF3558 domain-containing protein [unclassified Streptomyces]MCX5111267.1 DUF3558 domain-containing protein [Streptomyces sp. NBC_00378]